MMPVNAPLAALEWKVDRPGKAKQKPDGDRAWLTAFTEQNRDSLGFVVLVAWPLGCANVFGSWVQWSNADGQP